MKALHSDVFNWQLFLSVVHKITVHLTIYNILDSEKEVCFERNANTSHLWRGYLLLLQAQPK